MRQKELQDEEERMLKRQDLSSSSRTMGPVEVDHGSVGGTFSLEFELLFSCLAFTSESVAKCPFLFAVSSRRCPVDEEDIVSADQSCSTSISRQPTHLRTNR